MLCVKGFSAGEREFRSPGRTPVGDGVQLQHQLPHHRHQSHLSGFAPLTQTLVKGPQASIMPRPNRPCCANEIATLRSQ